MNPDQKVDGLLNILEMDYTNLPPAVRKVAYELKRVSILALLEQDWFSDELSHGAFLSELCKPESKWFVWCDDNPKDMQIIADIFRKLGESAIVELQEIFGKSDPDSTVEKRIGIILQLINDGVPVTRNITMNFLGQ